MGCFFVIETKLRSISSAEQNPPDEITGIRKEVKSADMSVFEITFGKVSLEKWSKR